jgi:hypothetical protein
MKKFHNFSENFSNWETVALIIIKKLLVGNNLRFSRSELMTYSNLENARKLLIFCFYKEDPQKPENTLQRTIQNLRDKGYILFLGNGEYKLTVKGETAINSFDASLFETWKIIQTYSVAEVVKIKEEAIKKYRNK